MSRGKEIIFISYKACKNQTNCLNVEFFSVTRQ